MANVIWTRHAADDAPRSTVRRERLSIDLRGHGPAMNALAQAMQVPVAVLVRTVLADWLAKHSESDVTHAAVAVANRPTETVVKVTLRMPTGHAVRLARAARAAELSQGIYVARLIEAQPPVPVAPDQHENRTALIRSTAALAAVSSDLQALIRILRQPSFREHAAPTVTLAQLSDAINLHLAAAAPLIAALKPSWRSAARDSV